MKAYYPYKASLTADDGIIMYGSRILIPSSLRMEMLERLHTGHQRITKCKRLAQQSTWWPGMSTQIEEMVKQCRVCAQNAKNRPEPLMPSSIPQRPWQKVASDLFQFEKQKYLLTVDFHSRYIEIARFSTEKSSEVIRHFKSILARHGIPEVLVSHNGPQHTASEFKAFTSDYGIHHITSSPGHASGNGEAERAVRTIKQLSSSDNSYAAILMYRATLCRTDLVQQNFVWEGS